MRPFPFQSIKRALHTSAARARPAKRMPLVAAGSALAFSGYLAWRVSSQPVYMDSSPDISPKLRTISEKVQEPSSSRLIEEDNTETNETVQPGPTDPSLETQEGSEEEASQAAFNPVTGEINWDCPCLGGMAHGPCGPQFREAFSCFVYSEEEPKGINCVEKFKGMQDCFRLHPEVYGEEILEEDSDEEPSDLNEAPASLNTEESITPSSAS